MNKTQSSMKNKKLRLLVTKECHNNCPKCCNKLYDLDSIPVIDRFDYDEVCITGGEPMLDFKYVLNVASMFKTIALCQDRTIKVYIYTANMSNAQFLALSKVVDGFVYTPHSDADVGTFIDLNNSMLRNTFFRIRVEQLSLRLNLFADVKEQLHGEDFSLWKIKDMEWLDDCPVPEGEDFRRVTFI